MVLGLIRMRWMRMNVIKIRSQELLSRSSVLIL